MAFYGTFTDGKISAVYRNGQSIGCCCQTEPACCMYSATTLASGDMGASDLPDAITLLGVGSLSRSGTGYGDTTDGVIFETDAWAIYRDGVRTTRNCLIQGDGKFTPGDDLVEDQFEATYTLTLYDVEYNSVISTNTVTRVGLCQWLSESTGQGLTYYPDLYVQGRYTWIANDYSPPPPYFPSQDFKTQLSSPVGTYYPNPTTYIIIS